MQKAWLTKQNFINWTYQYSDSSKATFKRMKGQATDWEKIFATCLSDKVLFLEYVKNSQNSVIRK